jgi:regulator of sirC expression with transglutaminase-like and TPR domain
MPPVHCRPSAYALFAAQMPRLESRDALLAAAVAIAKHAVAGVEPEPIEHNLDAVARRVRDRVHSGEPAALLAHAHAVLFEEEGFVGNTREYHDERNSYLHEVLRRKVGIPITLGLVYAGVLWRIGLDARGVNAPGHFLVRIEDRGTESYVDAFHGGRTHSRGEALLFLARIHGKALDPATALPIATHRQWIYRMLQNLKGIFRDAKRRDDHVAMLELEALLPPPAP